ncbi:hypothetical protein K443DRAFT_677369 [Laccaria amethystina LaAM-08-1]|uniref:Uncharacterized protein n=1 Tax=Laccaria amethystina LaAM-08-1 TaxID=1095629 RepID=A0A0C9WUB6_9AGAR|nr:hypothetical protein K443DRAFT_677369 [Laccaria amethystina LaAM-08-1]
MGASHWRIATHLMISGAPDAIVSSSYNTTMWIAGNLNACLGTFSEAVYEEVRRHLNAEFIMDDSGQSDEFEVITQNDAGWGAVSY